MNSDALIMGAVCKLLLLKNLLHTKSTSKIYILYLNLNF